MENLKLIFEKNKFGLLPLIFLFLCGLWFFSLDLVLGLVMMFMVALFVFLYYKKGLFDIETLKQRKDVSLGTIRQLIENGSVTGVFLGKFSNMDNDFFDAKNKILESLTVPTYAESTHGRAVDSSIREVYIAVEDLLVVRLQDGSYRYVEVSNGLNKRIESIIDFAKERGVPVRSYLDPRNVGHPILAGVIFLSIIAVAVGVIYCYALYLQYSVPY